MLDLRYVNSARYLYNSIPFDISDSNLKIIIHDLDYNYTLKSRVVRLSDKNKDARLKHCIYNQSNQLDNIIFTDESYFKEYNYTMKSW